MTPLARQLISHPNTRLVDGPVNDKGGWLRAMVQAITHSPVHGMEIVKGHWWAHTAWGYHSVQFYLEAAHDAKAKHVEIFMRIKPRDFSLQEAATQLGITRFFLVRELERLGALEHDGNFGPRPTAGFRDSGYFRVQPRSKQITDTFTRHYHLTTITVQGLAWIERELMQALQQAS